MTDLKDGGAHGTIKITKGKLTDPGTLEVNGCRNRREFGDMVARIGKKNVILSKRVHGAHFLQAR